MKCAALALLAAPALANPTVTSLRSRSRALKEELTSRVQRYNEHATSKLGRSFSVSEAASSMLASSWSSSEPNKEVTSYWDYPMTLDYVVDISVANASDGVYSSYSVIVDTGSSNLALALASCECGVGDSDLDLEIDESECIEVTYGSGAWSGYETEAVSVGFVDGDTKLVTTTTLAGITSQTDFFSGGGYTGILGLGYADLSESYSAQECSKSSEGGGSMSMSSSSGGQRQSSSESSGAQQRREEEARRSLSSSSVKATPLLDVMNSEGLLNSDVFTLAFCSISAVLAIGGVDSDALESEISYVDVQKTYGEFYGYYLVYLESVSVGGDKVDVTSSSLNAIGGVLVDSGTTLLYLPSAAVKLVETAVAAAYAGASTKFFSMMSCVAEADLEFFPDITLQLSGLALQLTPKEYTLKYGACYYWGISSSDVGIIGNIALQNRLVVFDRESNTIGFAKADCGPGETTVSDAAQPGVAQPRSSIQTNLAAVTAVTSSTSLGEKLVEISSSTAVYALTAGAALTALLAVAAKRGRGQRRTNYETIATADLA